MCNQWRYTFILFWNYEYLCFCFVCGSMFANWEIKQTKKLLCSDAWGFGIISSLSKLWTYVSFRVSYKIVNKSLRATTNANSLIYVMKIPYPMQNKTYHKAIYLKVKCHLYSANTRPYSWSWPDKGRLEGLGPIGPHLWKANAANKMNIFCRNYEIFLTILVSVASGEISLSKLKTIKKKLPDINNEWGKIK